MGREIEYGVRSVISVYVIEWQTDKCVVFVDRISPQVLLNDVRHEIPIQLGDEYLPKDYAFLKSVGRCLTQVNFVLIY